MRQYHGVIEGSSVWFLPLRATEMSRSCSLKTWQRTNIFWKTARMNDTMTCFFYVKYYVWWIKFEYYTDEHWRCIYHFNFRLSGFMLPSPIVSSGSILALWFTTDFAVSAQGFKAIYEGRTHFFFYHTILKWPLRVKHVFFLLLFFAPAAFA